MTSSSDIRSLLAPPVVLVRPTLRDFVALTKPAITRMCLLMTALGLLVAPGSLSMEVLVATLLGTAGAVGAANALNMWWERDTDGRMARTRTRPLPAGRMPAEAALFFGVVLGLDSLLLLAAATPPWTAALAAVALLSYVFVYTPLKTRSSAALLVGAIPGAMPPLLGWTAVTGTVDAAGLALFGILFVWQLPHFLAISLMRHDEYAQAGIRTLTVTRGKTHASRQAVLWAFVLVPTSLLPSLLGVSGGLYLALALVLGLAFLAVSIAGLTHTPGTGPGQRLFLASLMYLPALVVAFLVDGLVL